MKKSKRMVLMMAMVLALTIALAGCSGEEAPSGGESSGSASPEGGAAAEDKLVIGVTFDYVSDFMAYVADGTAAYGEEHPDVDVVILDANKDVSKQLKDAENLIAQKVDAIVIKPVDSDATSPISLACKEAGIPLVNANTPMNSEVTSFVGSNSLVAGRLQAEYLVELIGEEGTVNILLGDPNNQDSRDRTSGNKEILQKYAGLSVGAEQVGKWMRDTGMQVTENWIQSKAPMDAILANNDEMAIGAAMAAADAGLSIPIIGVDATPDALKMVKEGTMAATVFQNGFQQGYVGVETAVKAARGEVVEAKIDIPYELVTPDNVDEYFAKYE